MQPPLRGMKMGTFEILKLIVTQQMFDPLEFALQVREQYGDLSYHELGALKMYYLMSPDLVHELLVEKADKFHKGQVARNGLKSFLGNGLLLSEGDFWKRQRKLAQPAFHAKRIEAYATTMVAFTQQLLERWQDGQTRDISAEMMQLTLQIVSKTLFDADVSADAPRVGELLTEILEAANRRINTTGILPEWLPTPERRREQAAVREIETILRRFIEDRRQSGEDRGDLLSMLMLARDDDGKTMSERQLLDEALTLFLAGHETTAMALTWAWYLLATHPDALAALQREVDMVLAGRAPTLADLPNLPYSDLVIKETMRLYPPAPGVSREAVEDVTLGGYPIKQGTMVAVSFYAMHRDGRYFENPQAFMPERFDKAHEGQFPRYAYQPFGAGPRVCIGNSFAMLEARLALATMAQRYTMALVDGQQIVPQQLVTIRPKDGIRMRLTQREAVLA